MILISPVITEKTLTLASQKKYTFFVDLFSTKSQIKKSVENQFSVKVLNIKTNILPPRRYRLGKKYAYGYRQSRKKAVVEIKPDQSIPLFETSPSK